MEPLFLLSLPRSGSTLLQRVLACHPEIETTSEPWLLLPLVYMFRKTGIKAEYDHEVMAIGLEDFCRQLSDKGIDRNGLVRDIALHLYERAGGSAKFFLDKTPRYHLIVDELLSIFPSAKFILLWRNPLAVAASMMETWSDGKWNLHRFRIDLYDGLANLVRIYDKEPAKFFTIRFEDFVSEPEIHFRQILEHLELPFYESAIREFPNISFSGRLGDPTGIREYNAISKNSIYQWKNTLSNSWRKSWARRYLDWIGPVRLSMMGYRIEDLSRELSSTPLSSKHLFSDIARAGYRYIYRKV